MIKRLFGSLLERHMLENANAVAAQNAADIEYLSMMTGVDLDSEEVVENVEEV